MSTFEKFSMYRQLPGTYIETRNCSNCNHFEYNLFGERMSNIRDYVIPSYQRQRNSERDMQDIIIELQLMRGQMGAVVATLQLMTERYEDLRQNTQKTNVTLDIVTQQLKKFNGCKERILADKQIQTDPTEESILRNSMSTSQNSVLVDLIRIKDTNYNAVDKCDVCKVNQANTERPFSPSLCRASFLRNERPISPVLQRVMETSRASCSSEISTDSGIGSSPTDAEKNIFRQNDKPQNRMETGPVGSRVNRMLRRTKPVTTKNKELMNDIITNCKLKNGFGPGVSPAPASPTKRPLSPDHPNPALPITESPSPAMSRMGWALRTLLVADSSSCLKDRKVSGKLIRKCAPGTELVDWLVNLSPIVHTRAQAAGMWQALLEEGVLAHVNKEQPFKDKCFLYRFRVDEEGTGGGSPQADDISASNDHVREALGTLFQRGPDATLRMILRKPSHERSPEELELVFEELLHIAALSHLSTSIKRELASIIVFESHAQAGTILFNQGDEGRSWYILLKGSVDVVIHGKGTVATLKTGDDFGKLALINDAPRAATIVLKENNCHLLRVDKEHFNRILRDVEANTLRLQEHGKDVLVLERVAKQRGQHSAFKYTVMSGTPSKMLEHLLETRLGGQVGGIDPFLDDFLLTHIVFMPVVQLVDELMNYFHCDSDGSQTPEDREYNLNFKKRVVQFLQKWVMTVRHAAFDEPAVCDFIEDLAADVEADPDLNEEMSIIHNVLTQLSRYQEDRNTNAGQKWKLPPNGQPICLFSGNTTSRTVIRPDDDIIFRVYCADHTYCTLRFPLHTTAEIIKACAADKLQLNRGPEDLALVEVKSNGERSKFKDNDVSIPTGLSLNGRLFVSVKDHLDALTPLPEQEGPTEGVDVDLEILSTKELAYHITIFDWDLFWAVHEYELLYHTFGRHHFGKITANLDVFLRRFNEIQYWIVTEIVSTSSMSKRVGLLRKFIKLAAYCKEYQNLNAFFAIVMGLSNMAVSRLQQTWDKIPSKFRKLFQEFEALIDPSRNHRAYRVFVGKLQPPVIPFMPLLLKDMTFAHEGNKTSLDGLVNFEKMHMMAQTMRTIRFCRSRSIGLEPPSPKSEGEMRSYISCLRVIDNQRALTAMSQKIEPTRKMN